MKDVDQLITSFMEKDYFFTEQKVQTQIANRDYCKSQGQNVDSKYTDTYIKEYIWNREFNKIKLMCEKLFNSIKGKDFTYLNSVLSYRNEFLLCVFEFFVGVTLPRTNKGIQSYLKMFCKV